MLADGGHVLFSAGMLMWALCSLQGMQPRGLQPPATEKFGRCGLRFVCGVWFCTVEACYLLKYRSYASQTGFNHLDLV